MKLTLFCEHSVYIHHLESEIEWLKTQLIHERNRAEAAVNERLRHIGAPPLRPVEPESPELAVLKEALTDSEFLTAGGLPR